MNRYEKQKKAVEKAISEKIEQYREIYKTAEADDRDPTDEERLDIESHLKAIETLKAEREEAEENIKTLQHVDDIGRSLGPAISGSVVEGDDVRVGMSGHERLAQYAEKTLGRMFVESEAFKSLDSGNLGRFDTGSVELRAKGTLLEGVGTPGSGSGGGLIPVPQVVPGVVETLFQQVRVADLLMSGPTNTSNIRYVVEGTATSGAAGVAEGAAKPQSSLGLGTKDMPVTKVATSLKVSDEMLADAAQVESYINGRLSLFVLIEEERQLVRGVGSGSNELQGIIGATGVNTYARGTVDDNATALFKAMNGQRGSAFLEPDWIVINPANWQTTRLAKDTAGQFLGGGPFIGAYGNQSQVGASGQVTGAQDTIWNKPVIVTTAVGAGTALIGTRAAAQLWTRGGLTVQATNSNEDDFLHDLVAIRAEKREALTIYRPVAYTVVSGLA